MNLICYFIHRKYEDLNFFLNTLKNVTNKFYLHKIQFI
jgi:hypothetical protein